MKPLRSRQLLGKKGEQIAAEYLQNHGYFVIDRNVRIRYGEIDIIARYQSTIVFIEVKTRTTDRFGIPEEAITQKKLRDMTRAARVYVDRTWKTEPPMRLDVLAVVLDSFGNLQDIRHTIDVR